MKVRIVKDNRKYRVGQIVDVNARMFKQLLKEGVARADKMLSDWKTK